MRSPLVFLMYCFCDSRCTGKHENKAYPRFDYILTLEVGAGAKAEAEAKRAREQAAENFMVFDETC